MSVALCLGLVGAARAAVVYSGGPNPNWTDIQKYEWYVGYIARTSRICGAHTEAAILTRLARMSPYGSIGLSQMRGDSFLRNACLRITEDAREMVDDAARIEQHIEATYDCSDDACFGQSLSDWQFHDCGNSLKSQFEILNVDRGDIRAVTMMDPAKTGSDAAHQARVQFHSCQGSLYIDLTEQCVMDRTRTRGDCAIPGVGSY